MSLIVLAFAIALLIFLIVRKVNPMLALLAVAIGTGLCLNMPVQKLTATLYTGLGNTLSTTATVLALGAMIGKLAEESGAAQTLVFTLTRWFGLRHIQWAVLFTGLLAGIPLFYNAGFVVLIPLVFAIAKATRLPLLYVGLPMAAALSVTHGFLPPHPGPVALAAVFKASVGKTLLYGLLLALPIAVIAGIAYARLSVGRLKTNQTEEPLRWEATEGQPSAARSFLILLSPVLFITFGTIGNAFSTGAAKNVFFFLQEPTFALLLSLALALLLVKLPMEKSMLHAVEGVKSIAMILLIIAAGGAFKQVLVDGNVGADIRQFTSGLNLSPLFAGWLLAALFRVALGSATVAALTASGLVLPFLTAGVSPELMVLAVGAGSIFCSHVNDTGFWMFKEYFGLSIRDTFRTWTVMETLISILGLLGVLLLGAFV